MKQFLTRYADKILGVLSGFDRVVFRGTLRQISHVLGLEAYLAYKRVFWKDFGEYSKKTSDALKAASLKRVEKLGRPVLYLPSASIDKERVALQVLQDNPVEKGLVCVLTSVEPCQTFDIHRCRETKKIELRVAQRKCLHFYHYFLHPDFGFMNARLQTWFPFTLQVCLNGRTWLAKQLDAAKISYERRDNCFSWVGDVEKAQRLLQKQLSTDWSRVLSRIAAVVNPGHREIFRGDDMDHYWSVYQAEWATDVMFHKPEDLAEIYPPLVQHAITQFSSSDVMRFLGRRLHGNFKGEVVSDYKNRPEGVRVKHRVNSNSIKIYDKQGSVLRVETTINNPRDIKVFRPAEANPNGKPSWRPLRKGIADTHRLATVSQQSNERYLDALSVVKSETPLADLLKEICRPVDLHGRRLRALRPWDESEVQLLQAVNRGEFVITGLRNRDIANLLFPTPASSPAEQRRRRGRVSRLLRLLRAHKLIRKVQKTHRYQVTARGREAIGAILAARNASVNALLKAS